MKCPPTPWAAQQNKAAQAGNQGADVAQSAWLKFLWLQAGGLGRQAQVQRGLQQWVRSKEAGVFMVFWTLEISNKLAPNVIQ